MPECVSGDRVELTNGSTSEPLFLVIMIIMYIINALSNVETSAASA